MTELAAPFDQPPPISKHLKVLERAGLVSRGRDALATGMTDGMTAGYNLLEDVLASLVIYPSA